MFSSGSQVFTTAFCFVFLGWFLIHRRVTNPSRHKLPPGPKPLPLVGNLFDMPRNEEWVTFSRWRELYGDVVYVRIMGRPIVILTSLEAITDLLEKRYNIYSDRPVFPLVDLIGHQWNFGFKQYGKEWLSLRRIFSSKYSTQNALRSYHDSQRASVACLLQNLLRDPCNFVDHITLRSNQLIIDVTYGISITSSKDPLIQVAEAVMSTVSVALSPVMWIVNPFAISQYLTSLFGGNDAIFRVQKWRTDLEQLRNVPFNETKASLASGCAKPSFTASLLQELGSNYDHESELMIRDCAAVAFGAASETTIASAMSFLLAMALNLHVQKFAQEEIDRVIGSDRLPDYADKPDLPYITAVMKETIRFHAPAPSGKFPSCRCPHHSLRVRFLTGVPHLLRQDDEYKGFHLPAGSIVIGNIEGLLHDPSIYPDPYEFKPERYLHSGEVDPARIAFGFGRRVCPGKSLAEDTLWLMVAQFLAVYSISPVDEKSPPPIAFIPGAISRPVPFPCVIRPRSDSAKNLIDTAGHN
ncbi:hypothetical protein EW146_g3718 [Bondarzewia mesenterica]|uniref:Cytochrome P450 n=1 Tax=Bondarzewia mesenterica TaxID=1095465 RepID=A0A4V3XFD2_9AGAM|nr:hypothetical protein EW146_g3718 [Bondarzewia mesenterica]